MGPKTRAVLLTFGLGAVVGAVLAQQSIGRHRSDLFSRRPMRRLSALSYLSGHASVDTVRLLHDYLSWERHPMLRRRADSMLRRMEAKLG